MYRFILGLIIICSFMSCKTIINNDEKINDLLLKAESESNSDNKIEYLDKIISINPSEENALLMRGKEFFKINKYNDSINDLKLVIQINKKNIDALVYLAKNYYTLEKYDLSEKLLLEAIQLDPTDYWFRFYLSKIYEDTYRYDLALDYINMAIKLNPTYSYLYCTKSRILWTQKKFEESISVAKEAIMINDSDQYAKYLILLNNVYQGNFENAERMIDDVFPNGYDRLERYNIESFISFEKSNYTEAINLIMKTKNKAKVMFDQSQLSKENYKRSNIIVNYHLSLYNYSAGNLVEAKNNYNELKKLKTLYTNDLKTILNKSIMTDKEEKIFTEMYNYIFK